MAPVPMAMPVVVMAGMVIMIMPVVVMAGMVMLARSVLVGVPIRHRTHFSTEVIGDRLSGSLPTTHSGRG